MTFLREINNMGDISTVCPHSNLINCVKLNSIQEKMIYNTMTWFGHAYVSELSIH